MFPIYAKNFVLPKFQIYDTQCVFASKYAKNYKSRSLLKSFIAKKMTASLINNKNKTFDKFASRSLWQKLVNQYWQETVYLSIANSDSDIYTKKIQSHNSLYNHNIDYKYFLNKFIKSLVNDQIPVSFNMLLNDDYVLFNKNYNMYLKYIWRKKLYLYVNYFNFFSNYSLMLKNKTSKSVTESIYNSLPLFSVKNLSNQIIMAELGESVKLDKNFISSWFNYISSSLIKQKNNKMRHTGLFFINPEDALEYQNYIQANHMQSSRNYNLSLSINSIYHYYKLLSSFCNADFRLIPDLKEISDFIYKYQYYKNIIIDKNQLYGKNYFKGQPIYMIKTTKAKDKNTNIIKDLEYNYFNSSSSNHYPAIFLNYKNAILAWNNFKEQHVDYILPLRPHLYVYNLEDFIQSYTRDTKTLVIPGCKAYSSVRKYTLQKSHLTFKEKIRYNALFTQKIIERVVWSLTSRQPLR
uniref:Uncharacterized protein n=1 Tax=Anotrichium furcellatum TaxID=41999 RepID=A0A4D6WPJ2_9FLOR|nr:hypothetical protein [Anotrichium furcellatum]